MSTHPPLIPAPDVILREEPGGEAVLYDQTTGRTFLLNSTGALIWDALLRGATPGELPARVRSWFPQPPADLDTVVARFLDDLLATGLVQQNGPPEPPSPGSRETPRSS